MSIKADSQLALTAVVHAPIDDITEAVIRAAHVLGSHLSATAANNKVVVEIYSGMLSPHTIQRFPWLPDRWAKKLLAPISPVVGVTLMPGANDLVTVSARIEKYVTVQVRNKATGIAVSPKRMVGKGSYKHFLQSLQQELRAVSDKPINIQSAQPK